MFVQPALSTTNADLHIQPEPYQFSWNMVMDINRIISCVRMFRSEGKVLLRIEDPSAVGLSYISPNGNLCEPSC